MPPVKTSIGLHDSSQTASWKAGAVRVRQRMGLFGFTQDGVGSDAQPGNVDATRRFSTSARTPGAPCSSSMRVEWEPTTAMSVLSRKNSISFSSLTPKPTARGMSVAWLQRPRYAPGSSENSIWRPSRPGAPRSSGIAGGDAMPCGAGPVAQRSEGGAASDRGPRYRSAIGMVFPLPVLSSPLGITQTDREVASVAVDDEADDEDSCEADDL